jgi:molybdopterin-guanine dinucleotide biosynthesis protein A
MTPKTLAPLHGLVLAGGASRRMGRDKASIALHGKPQLEWACDLLARHCEQVFVSVRPDQLDDPLRRGLPVIVDRHEGIGPIAGIASAQAEWPEHAWLVLACDLPFVSDRGLDTLVAHRDGRPVTAYRSTHDGLPEPLCAIYEPQTRAAILAQIAGGRHCPRKFVMSTGVALLEQPDPTLLDNVNTPDELASARTQLDMQPPAPRGSEPDNFAAPAGESGPRDLASPASAPEVGRTAQNRAVQPPGAG